MGDFREHLPKLARCGVPRITLALTEKYVRGKLKLKKDQPLKWQDIPLNCIGSERWRMKRFLEAEGQRRADEEAKRRAVQPEGKQT